MLDAEEALENYTAVLFEGHNLRRSGTILHNTFGGKHEEDEKDKRRYACFPIIIIIIMSGLFTRISNDTKFPNPFV